MHRPPGAGRSTVYAFRSELDGWLRKRSGPPAPTAPPPAVADGHQHKSPPIFLDHPGAGWKAIPPQPDGACMRNREEARLREDATDLLFAPEDEAEEEAEEA